MNGLQQQKAVFPSFVSETQRMSWSEWNLGCRARFVIYLQLRKQTEEEIKILRSDLSNKRAQVRAMQQPGFLSVNSVSPRGMRPSPSPERPALPTRSWILCRPAVIIDCFLHNCQHYLPSCSNCVLMESGITSTTESSSELFDGGVFDCVRVFVITVTVTRWPLWAHVLVLWLVTFPYWKLQFMVKKICKRLYLINCASKITEICTILHIWQMNSSCCSENSSKLYYVVFELQETSGCISAPLQLGHSLVLGMW